MALIAVAAGILDSHRAFPGWWAVLPVAGSALLLSAPAAWLCRVVLASPPLVWIGLISYPLYLWHWPLLVFSAGIIKFGPLTLLERELILLASELACLGDLSVCREYRFASAVPSPRKMFSLCAGHGDGRGRRRCRRLGTRLRLPAAAGNSRDGQRADAEPQVAVP